MYRAIDSVNKQVLVIKNGKIIANGISISMRGNEFAGVRLSNANLTFLPDNIRQMMDIIGHLRFCPISGMYIEPTLGLDDEEFDHIESMFDKTYAVGELELRYGMVPDFFKNVEGYKSSIITE
jgi:hypothetical protein